MTFTGLFGTIPALAGSPLNLATGDVDADGDADLLITLSGASVNVVLWLNDGAGTFTQVAFPAIALTYSQVLLRDLDGDGDPDAVLGALNWTSVNGPGIIILTNVGGVFTPAASPLTTTIPSAFDLGNFNGDQYPDLIVSFGPPMASGQVFFGSASGFQTPVTTPSAIASAIVAVDLNGDGIDELVASGGGGLVLVRSVGANGVLGPLTQSWLGLSMSQVPGPEVVRDLDGDGDRDLIVPSTSSPVELMNAGTGSLVRLGGRTAGLTIDTTQHLCDFDGDGDLDVVGKSSSIFNVGLNDGSGWFTATTANPSANVFYSLNAFDGDGDGDSDFYAARSNAFAMLSAPYDRVFANVGGSLTEVATVSGTGMTSAFQAVDLDADGDQDIVLGTHGGPMVRITNFGGTGLSAPIPFGTVSHTTHDVDVADFNGDGLLDVFQTNSILPGATGPPDFCVTWLNNGTGFLGYNQVGISGFLTATGDLNADGLPDLVIDGQVWFNLGNGANLAGPMLPSPLAGAPTLADVDQDGDLDLVETPGTVFFNGGGGVFGPPVSYLPRGTFVPTAADVSKTTVVDVDADGDVDIIAPGPVILLNTTRQIARGSIARPGRPASIDLYGTPTGAWFLWGSGRDDIVATPALGHGPHRSRFRAARRDGPVHRTDGAAPGHRDPLGPRAQQSRPHRLDDLLAIGRRRADAAHEPHPDHRDGLLRNP